MHTQSNTSTLYLPFPYSRCETPTPTMLPTAARAGIPAVQHHPRFPAPRQRLPPAARPALLSAMHHPRARVRLQHQHRGKQLRCRRGDGGWGSCDWTPASGAGRGGVSGQPQRGASVCGGGGCVTHGGSRGGRGRGPSAGGYAACAGGLGNQEGWECLAWGAHGKDACVDGKVVRVHGGLDILLKLASTMCMC